MGWTNERVELLKTLLRDGLSATQIATAINKAHPGAGLSRNAVIGKVHRMGLGPLGGGRASKPARVPRAPREPRAPAPPRPAAPPRRQQPAPFGQLGSNYSPEPRPPTPPAPRYEAPRDDVVPFDALGAHMCKWPIGDPLLPGFGFCGRRVDAVSEAMARHYCLEHHHAAQSPDSPVYKPTKGNKRRVNDDLRALRRWTA